MWNTWICPTVCHTVYQNIFSSFLYGKCLIYLFFNLSSQVAGLETLHLFITSTTEGSKFLRTLMNDDTNLKTLPMCLKVSLCVYSLSFLLTMSAIRKVQVPIGFSPHVWTDMKSQFLKPLGDVSRSLSANRTVSVPIFIQEIQVNKCPNSSDRTHYSIC